MKLFAQTRRRLRPLATVMALLGLAATLITLPATSVAAAPLSAATESAPTDPAPLDPAPFDPGLIISDYNFFNPDALTAVQIQDFLEQRSCRPSDDVPCLWEYRETTTSQPAQGAGHCLPYAGAENETAARIIAKIAAACTISPEVLLVLLQKEQSLLTRPTASGYLRATGYGCPDTADCDAQYFGFFNQVYNAAWQFRQYTQEPDRAFQVGSVDVGFNPNAECGASAVVIENQATANLYNYTPYQPNPVAVENAGDEGDACSTYGNLNFWLFYNDWFGDGALEPFSVIFDDCLSFVDGQGCTPVSLLPTVAAAG
ncbi:hypothetical protein E3O06_00760 [Cryobacterium glaciale]|uniref:Hemagglutinin n=1 Tax=Cryobacterium glaciale TaxID=1259145 RepID=A0A4R8V6S5_9MICO|nr:hypothetical protein [Cryobacterium glaciale]TFB77319.1 hypothetical protein E3O06_00760 [Cryobacterium glaciale]